MHSMPARETEEIHSEPETPGAEAVSRKTVVDERTRVKSRAWGGSPVRSLSSAWLRVTTGWRQVERGNDCSYLRLGSRIRQYGSFSTMHRSE